MFDWKCRQREALVLKKHAGFHTIERDSHVWDLSRPENNLHQGMNPRQRHGPTVDVEFLHGLPTAKRAGKAAKPEDMVQMPVSKQNLVQPPEAKSGP